MELTKYNFKNFYLHTVANFSLCEMPDRPPDYFSDSGSAYWEFGDRVRRSSDHWGPNIASCCWFLDLKSPQLKHAVCGECYYEEFRPICLRCGDFDSDRGQNFDLLLQRLKVRCDNKVVIEVESTYNR